MPASSASARDRLLLRTHTSPVQIRTMERLQPPLRIIMSGQGATATMRPDATHSPVFHQVEGLAVDTHISFADLKGTLDYFHEGVVRAGGQHPLPADRFSPSPSPAPRWISPACSAAATGCRICKQSGWIELLGCGHGGPNVFDFVDYDPTKYSGFAFGMGVERLAMLKYGIADIQLFYQGDVRFLDQFA